MNKKMCDVTRRACLATIPTVGLVGCLSETPTPPALGELTVLNTQNESTRVSITITKDNEIMYDRDHVLDPSQNSSVDGVTIIEPWMGSGTDFTVRLDVPSIETEVFSTIKFEEEFNYEFDCIPLTIYIQDTTIESYYGTNGCS